MRTRATSPATRDAAASSAATCDGASTDDAHECDAAEALPLHGVFEEIVERSCDSIVVIDDGHKIRYANRSAETMFRRARANLIGSTLDTLIPELHSSRHRDYVEAFRSSADSTSCLCSEHGSMLALRGTGDVIPVAVSLIRLCEGSAVYVAAVISDLTERRTLEDKLKRLDCTDPVTGALNRKTFAVRAVEEMDRALRHKLPLAVALIEVDHLTRIASVHGRGVADVALKHAAQVVAAELRITDALGRWEDGVFIALFPHTDAEAAFRGAERVRHAIENAPLVGVSDGGTVPLTLSIGVAEFGAENDTFGAVVDRAEYGLDAARAGGSNRTVVVPNRPHNVLLS